MITLIARPIRTAAGVVAAAFVVGFGLLAMDQAYVAAAPRGVVEIGELRLLRLAQPGESISATAAIAPVG